MFKISGGKFLFLKEFILFSCIFLVHSEPSFAQPAPASSGSYAQDLGTITAGIRGAQWIADICSEAFPELRSKNQEAVDNWSSRYRPFIDEMTSKFEALPKQWAANERFGAKATPQFWEDFLNKQLDAAKNVVKQQFITLGPERKKLVCTSFPQSLSMEQWNMERSHINEVMKIRRGYN